MIPEPVIIWTWHLDQQLNFIKKNKKTPKKFDNDVMMENSDVNVIFLIYDQLEAIQKPDNNLLSYKNWKWN